MKISEIREEQEIINIEFESDYIGSYEVIPSANDQALNTTNKILRKDIVIKSIPYSRVPQASGGGYIVTIG